MTHILVDTANTFFRARHVSGRGTDLDTKISLAFHILFNSLKKANTMFSGSHVVFCLEGRSWRKDVYAPYKRNRKAARDALTEAQQEEAAAAARSGGHDPTPTAPRGCPLARRVATRRRGCKRFLGAGLLLSGT